MIMMIRMLNSMRKDRTCEKRPIENKNDIALIKNSLEGIPSRLVAAEDQISELNDKVEKNHSIIELKKKKKNN